MYTPFGFDLRRLMSSRCEDIKFSIELPFRSLTRNRKAVHLERLQNPCVLLRRGLDMCRRGYELQDICFEAFIVRIKIHDGEQHLVRV